jgi:hypothetical protein
VRETVHRVASVIDAVRRLHSGHVGDYVAWLLVSVTGLPALVGHRGRVVGATRGRAGARPTLPLYTADPEMNSA